MNSSTDWRLQHKLLPDREGDRLLKGFVHVGGERGRGAEGKTRLVAAEQVTDQDERQPVVLKPSVLEGFRKEELERWAREHLAPGTTVQSDGPGCFAGVEAAGCEHEATVTDGGKRDCALPQLPWVNTVPGNVKRSIDWTYHAVGPKYAGRYLADFLHRLNRRDDLKAIAGRLLRAAADAVLNADRRSVLRALGRGGSAPALGGARARRAAPGSTDGPPGGGAAGRARMGPVRGRRLGFHGIRLAEQPPDERLRAPRVPECRPSSRPVCLDCSVGWG